ncbi:DUF2157 domain-containing protein [Sphingorhabdus sp. M41]|uniref:DUF2157 domain-containing protein n=1 Tax=Sphingorhabdus sp. M41 TaxID=1806885 RepID=UPI00078D47CB|nr:DUF2157 domain-containing protein [Sphingorhabdus sp. M41]AMO71855.1 hypothetical protein AZE99_08325 [Sphingorhabdus sp. M41]
MSDRKIDIWLNAGLIDSETALRIRNYEADRSRPLGLWSLIGLGTLAIGLGIVSLVAANWDEIPGMVRLAVHGLLIAGTGAGIYLLQPRNGFLGLYLKDVLLFILAVLGATFFGHLGQVYQTSSPLWQPMTAWLLLFSPLLLLSGRGWLISLLWVVALLGTGIAHWGWYMQQTGNPSPIYIATITSLPVFALLTGVFAKRFGSRGPFWMQVGQFALASFVGGVSLKLIADGLSAGGLFGYEGNAEKIAIIHLVLWSAAALLAFRLHRTATGISIATILIAAALTSLIGSIAQSTEPLGNAILFMAFWTAIGWSAIYSGWRNLFQVVVTIIALRLIFLSFELASDLLSSGLGLILAGILTIGISVAAYRFSKAFAPDTAQPLGQKGEGDAQ